MYNLKERTYFTTIGELRMLLADLPDDKEIRIEGKRGGWLHHSEDKSLIFFANDAVFPEMLANDYPENHCPFCGEGDEIGFDREDDGDETIYWVTCQKCGKSWGQLYHLEFDRNIEYDEKTVTA